MNENGDHNLSDFGKKRVQQIASRKADRVDESASWWRYQAARLLALGQLGAGLSVVFGLLLIPLLAYQGGNVDWGRHFGEIVVMFVVAAVLGYAADRVENDFNR